MSTQQEQTAVRRISGVIQAINSTANQLPDLQESFQTLLNIISEQRKKIDELNKALDECAKLAKVDTSKISKAR